jgi:hypothetical protein
VVGLHRLPAYCVENLLIHEEAAVQIIIEEAAISAESARDRFAYIEWVAGLGDTLIDLSVWFAALNLGEPEHRTGGLGIGSVLTSLPGCLPEPDKAKIDTLSKTVEGRVMAAVGADESARIFSQIAARGLTRDRSADVVSGKDFLLSLFEFRLRKHIPRNTRRNSLRVRLARHCDVTLFRETVAAIERAARM